MSADMPSGANATPSPADRTAPAAPERAEPADDASRRPQADAGHPAQPAQTLNRADYNLTRHARPPIEASGAPTVSPADHAVEQPAQAPEATGAETRPWLSVAEADRTVGDTTPTGIGLKPTGEQLRDMESDDPARSRMDRLLDRALDRSDDIHDAAGQTAETITAFRHPDPSPSGQHAYTGHVARDHPQPPGQPTSDMAGSIVVMTVAAVAGLRYLAEHQRKEHEP